MLNSAQLSAIAFQTTVSPTVAVVDANFDALYEYYTSSECPLNSRMPYGTAKARTGDPYEFIGFQLVELVSAKKSA